MRILFNEEQTNDDEIVIDEIYVKLVGTREEDEGQSVQEFLGVNLKSKGKPSEDN